MATRRASNQGGTGSAGRTVNHYFWSCLSDVPRWVWYGPKRTVCSAVCWRADPNRMVPCWCLGVDAASGIIKTAALDRSMCFELAIRHCAPQSSSPWQGEVRSHSLEGAVEARISQQTPIPRLAAPARRPRARLQMWDSRSRAHPATQQDLTFRSDLTWLRSTAAMARAGPRSLAGRHLSAGRAFGPHSLTRRSLAIRSAAAGGSGLRLARQGCVRGRAARRPL
jgi:hypothetical protein